MNTVLRHHTSKSAAALALLLVAVASVQPVSARADAVEDQRKAYKALGIKVPNKAAVCQLLTIAEVGKYLGKPVQPGTSAGPVSGCAWRASDGSNDGLLVTRGARSDWYPPTESPHYDKVDGVGEKAYSAYEAGIGYEAGALTAKGVTVVQFSGKASAATAVEVLRIVVKR